MKTRLTVLSVALATCAVPLVTSGVAQAEECPPGSWFCEEAGAEEEELEPTDEPPPPERAEVPRTRRKAPPPIVVYRPEGEPPPAIVVVEKQPEKAPPKARKRWKREWGVNLRVQGVLMEDRKYGDHGNDHAEERGMGGLGVGLRYRPRPHFAFEAGLDFVGGRDYQGDERSESALTFNGLVFFNPKDKLQFYALGGFGFSGAHVVRDVSLAGTAEEGSEADYSYFGLQAGLGLEWRVGRKTALNFDVIGFVRGRTDDAAQYEYEFTDPETGRQTNSSGGGLMRLGLTFYW